MNTKTVERLCERLTGRERHLAIIAASHRGDHDEVDRLARSAPSIHVTLPDYYQHGIAFLILTTHQQMEFLSLIGMLTRFRCQEVASLAIEAEDDFEADGRCDDSETAAGLAAAYSWRLIVEEAAWETFWREDLGTDRDPLIGLPGEKLRRDVVRLAIAGNVTREDVADRLGRPIEEILTVETRLAEMRHDWKVWRDQVEPRERTSP